MPLEQETKIFQSNRAAWIAKGHRGKWVAIHGTEILGFFESFETAYVHGSSLHPDEVFLVKQVNPTDRVEIIQRAFWGTRGREAEIKG